MNRLRAALGRGALILGVALAALVALLAGALRFADSNRGHAFLLARALAAANARLNGRLEIAALEGSLFGEFQLRGIAVTDARGRTVLAIRRLAVAIEPRQLLSGVARVRAIEIDGPEVLAAPGPDGRLNLAGLLKPGPPEPAPPTGEGARLPGLRIEVGRFELRGGRARWEAPDAPPIAVEQVALVASATVGPRLADARISRLVATSTLPSPGVLGGATPVRVALTAAARLEDAAPGAPAPRGAAPKLLGLNAPRASSRLDLHAPGAELTVDAPSIDLESLTMDVAATVSVRASLLRLLGLPPSLPLGAEVPARPGADPECLGLVARVRPGTAAAPWRVAINGMVAGAPLSLSADAGPRAGAARLDLAALDPARIAAAAPPGRLALDLQADFSSWTRGQARLRIEGPLTVGRDPVRLEPLQLELRVEPDRARAELELELRAVGSTPQRGPPASTAAIRMRGEGALVFGAAPALDGVRLRVSATAPDQLLPRLLPVAGAFEVVASATGPLDDLALGLTVRGSTLAAGPVRLDRLELDATGRAGGGHAEVSLRGAGSGRGTVRDLQFALSAGRAPSGQAHAVIEQLALAIPGARWTAGRARLDLAPDGALAIRDLRLDGGPAGQIAVAGVVPRAGTATGAEAEARTREPPAPLRLEVRHLDLGAAAALLGTATVAVGRGTPPSPPAAAPSPPRTAPARRAQGTLDARALVAADRLELQAVLANASAGAGHPVDARVEARAGAGRFEAALRAGSRALGRITVDARGRAPRAVLDGSAWRSVVLAPLDLRLDSLDLGELQALAGTATAAVATIDGRAHLDGGGPLDLQGEVVLGARGLRVAGLRDPLALALDARARPDELTARVTVSAASPRPARTSSSTASAVELVAAELTTVGTRVLRRGPAELLARPARLHVSTGALEVADLVALIDRGRLGPNVDAPRGRIALELAAAGTLSALTVTASASARGLGLAATAPDLDADVRLGLEPAGAGTPVRTTAGVPAGARAGSRARADLGVRVSGAGQVHAAAELKTPDLRDAGAWRALDERALERLTLEVRALALGPVARLLSLPPALAGKVYAAVEIGPSLDRGHARLQFAGLAFDERLAPLDGVVSSELDPGRVTTTASVSAGAGPPLVAAVTLTPGASALARGGLARARVEAALHGHGVPLDALLRTPDRDVPGADLPGRAPDDLASGLLEVEAALHGALAGPEGRARVQLTHARLGRVPFDKVEAEASFAGAAASGRLLLAQAAGGTLSINADRRAATDGNAPKLYATLDARAFDLGFASTTLGALTRSPIGFAGRLGGRLEASGSGLEVKGALHIEDARAVLPSPAPAIERTRIDLTLGDRRGRVDVQGQIGGGTYQLSLNGGLARGGGSGELEGRLRTAGMRVSAAGQTLLVDTQIGLHGRGDEEEARLDVEIDRTLIRLPNEQTEQLRVVKPVEDVEIVEEIGKAREEPPPPPARRTALAVAARTRQPVQVRGADADARVTIDLTYRAQGASEALNGRVDTEQGRVKIAGKDYEVERARLLFYDRVPPDPRLDILVAHDFNLARRQTTVRVFIQVRGQASAPEVILYSEPANFSQAELLALVFGAEPEDSGSASTQEHALSAAAGLVAGQLRSKLGSKIPIDTIQFDPGDNGANGSVLVGQWILDDVFIAYRRRFAPKEDENQSEGILRWAFARRWTLEMSYGDRTIGGADAVWRLRF